MRSAALAVAFLALAWAAAKNAPAGKRPLGVPIFHDVAAETGLRFQHFTGATGEYLLPEIMGAGVALFDYDGDGDLDIYLLQGTMLDPRKSLKQALFPPPRDHWPGHRLFRNEIIPSGKLQFTDVTEQSRLGFEGYGMGVAVGDFDNDGHPDLYVTNVGSNILYRNNGDGTFADVTREAGLDEVRWPTSAAFLDYDRDGNLDLFVANYVDFTVRGNISCYDKTGAQDYCNPAIYHSLPGRLFRNTGKGKFVDVTVSSGIGAAFGKGLGVVCADFNSDGWTDIFVANDGTESQLWINQRNGTFKDLALISGVAYNADGAAQAGMGVTSDDFDNDGDEDLFVTHLAKETNALYVNDGRGSFSDATIQYGLSQTNFSGTGFGTKWFDYDNDGFLDLFVANGSVTLVEALRGKPYPYQQRNQLFHNESGKFFRDVSLLAGPALQVPGVGRGAAFGDINNDGAIDIVVTNNNGPVQLLLNDVGTRHHWLMIGLRAARGNRFAIGAKVGLFRRGQKPLWRRVHADGSYLSSSDIRVSFGLGDSSAGLESVVVEWPSGEPEIWKDVRIDMLVTLRQGTGERWH